MSNMSSLNHQQINNVINGTLSSYVDVNATLANNRANDPTTYSIYAVLNATIETYADTTNLVDISIDDVFNRLENTSNETDILLKRDHVFDRTDVRVIFTIIYSLVFCCCFFGKFPLPFTFQKRKKKFHKCPSVKIDCYSICLSVCFEMSDPAFFSLFFCTYFGNGYKCL